jgi:methyl-accepting chemotaxis protein
MEQAPRDRAGGSMQQGDATQDTDSRHGTAGHISENLKRTAGTVAAEAGEIAAEAGQAAKARGAEQISGVSRAMHDAAEALGGELPQASGFIHRTAEKLEAASSTLSESSVEDLVSSFNRLARQRPAAAFAGSVLAGFALSRFLKSSAPRS